MNIHHLELFYFVAKYEGITAAVRRMPYGIQQPAVSGQILQLEKELGVKLFNRRPFALTPAGDELYDFVYPFFSQVGEVEARLKGEEGSHLRIAASGSALRIHLPDLLAEVRTKRPSARFSLREVEPGELQGLLKSLQVDLAISIIGERITEGLQTVELLKIPLVLLVPEQWKERGLSDLLAKNEDTGRKAPRYPLVGLPAGNVLGKIFLDTFEERGVDLVPDMEVDSLDLVGDYVSWGFGMGMGVEIPGKGPPDGLRAIPLKGFSPVVVGAIHQENLKPIASDFLELARERAKNLAKSS